MNNLSKVGAIDLGITLENVLWVTFAVATLTFLVISIVLIYHWRKYGMKNRHFILAEIIYFTVSAAIIFVALIAILLV